MVRREEKVELRCRVSQRQLGLSTISELQFIMSVCTACGSVVHVVTAWKNRLLWIEDWNGGFFVFDCDGGEILSCIQFVSGRGEGAESSFCCAVAPGAPDEPFGTDSMRTGLLF